MTMHDSYWIVNCPKHDLDLYEYYGPDLDDIIEHQGCLLWNFQGLYGRITHTQLQDIVGLISPYTTWSNLHPHVHVPKNLYKIQWEQVTQIELEIDEQTLPRLRPRREIPPAPPRPTA